MELLSSSSNVNTFSFIKIYISGSDLHEKNIEKKSVQEIIALFIAWKCEDDPSLAKENI